MILSRKSFFFSVAVLMLGSIIVAGAWTDAPLNPPANNVAAPVNVGNAFQIKEGGLQLRGLFVEGKGVFSTSTYSIPSNTTFAVNGAVSANTYCDVNGQNCKSAADIASAVTGGAGGDKIVCGGWDTKYGAGTVDGSQWGCVPAGATSCPAGYDEVSTSHATINLAEHTNLCVLSRAGGSADQAIAGWPNFLVCSAGGVDAVFTIQAKGFIQPHEIAYVMPTYDGSQPMLFYHKDTRAFSNVIAQGTMGPAVSAAIESCKKNFDEI